MGKRGSRIASLKGELSFLLLAQFFISPTLLAQICFAAKSWGPRNKEWANKRESSHYFPHFILNIAVARNAAAISEEIKGNMAAIKDFAARPIA